jgi:hypothetical protein
MPLPIDDAFATGGFFDAEAEVEGPGVLSTGYASGGGAYVHQSDVLDDDG